MTIEEIAKEKRYAERRIENAIREFMERTALKDWQIEVRWTEVSVSTMQGSAGTPGGHMALLTVRV